MSERNEARWRDPVAEALRALYAEKAEAAGFQPVQLGVRWWMPARRVPRFLPLVVAVVLVAAIGALTWAAVQQASVIAEPVVPPPTQRKLWDPCNEFHRT